MKAKEFLKTEGNYDFMPEEVYEIMERYAQDKARDAFEAARNQEIVGTGAYIDLVYKYPTFDDYLKSQEEKQ